MTRAELITHLEHLSEYVKYSEDAPALREAIEILRCSEIPNSSEERTETHACDLISMADVDQTVEDNILYYTHSDRPIDQDPDTECHKAIRTALKMLRKDLRKLPSAQPEQRYTEEELRVFQHGISLSLLSKRSAQHWRYDEDTATEIKFLERLYDKVVADMGDEQDG